MAADVQNCDQNQKQTSTHPHKKNLGVVFFGTAKGEVFGSCFDFNLMRERFLVGAFQLSVVDREMSEDGAVEKQRQTLKPKHAYEEEPAKRSEQSQYDEPKGESFFAERYR